jgi:hypothetical protein
MGVLILLLPLCGCLHSRDGSWAAGVFFHDLGAAPYNQSDWELPAPGPSPKPAEEKPGQPAKAPPPKPPPAEPYLKPDGRPLILGIGAVESLMDGTSESFSLYRYLENNPVVIEDKRVLVTLVDHPAEADYTLSGTTTGTMTYDYKSREIAPSLLILGYTGGGAFTVFGIMGIAIGGGEGDAMKTIGYICLPLGLLALGGVGLYQYLDAKDFTWNHYSWELQTDVWVWKDGRKVKNIKVGDKKTLALEARLGRFRAAANEPLWKQVAEEVGKLVAQEMAGQGVQP